MSKKRGIETWKWDFEKRLDFQSLLQQGYTLPKVISIWKESGIYDITPSMTSLSKEIRLGLTEEERKNKQYVKYDIMRVYKNLVGDKAFEYILSHKGE